MTEPVMITPEQYKAMLLNIVNTIPSTPGADPALSYTIAELEETVLGAGMTLPIVRLPLHYHRMANTCSCGLDWPCINIGENTTAPE